MVLALELEEVLNQVLDAENIKVFATDQTNKKFIVVNLTAREAIDLLWLFRGDNQFMVVNSNNKDLLRTLAKLIREKSFGSSLRRSLFIEIA